MDNLFIRVLLIIIGFGLLSYAIISFVLLNFNVMEWSVGARVGAVMLWGLSSVCGVAIIPVLLAIANND